MPERFSKAVLGILQKGGWFNGREVLHLPLSPPQFKLFAKAEEVLREFGGLHIGECGPGIECATSDVNFDPRMCVHLATDLGKLEESQAIAFFPLGEVQLGHCYLLIDENGKTYLLNDELLPLAPTFAGGLEALLLGKKGE